MKLWSVKALTFTTSTDSLKCHLQRAAESNAKKIDLFYMEEGGK